MKPLYRGDTRTVRVTITNESGPVNIGGHTLWVTFKKKLTDPDPGALQVSAVPPSHADTAVGIGEVKLTDARTNVLDPGLYYYDVQWVAPGIVKTVEAGRVRVKPDRTRSTS